MISPPFRILPVGLSLILLGCSLVAFVNVDALEQVGVGVVLGTLFAQTTLAASWCALGPAPLIWRLPFSLVWIAALTLAFAINVLYYRSGPDNSFWVVFSIGLMGQWALVQAVLWALVIGYGLRLRHLDTAQVALQHRERQFGIRQLMILTAIIAVALGIGRVVASRLPNDLNTVDETAVLAFLAVAAIIMTLPLLLAALLPRYCVLAVIGTSLLISVATAWELPLLNLVVSSPGGGPDALHLIYINLCMALWIVVFVFAIRLSGYGIDGLSAKMLPANAPS